MNVAQVVDKFLPITESWIYSQIIGLQEQGIESEAFCHKIICPDTHPFNPIHSYKDIPNWKTNYYRTKGKLLKKDGATLYWDQIIKKGDFDLVHSHFGWSAQKGIDIAIKNNLPHVVTFYGSDVTRDPFDPGKKEYQNKLPLIFDYSKIILCTSEFLRNKLLELNAPKNKIVVWRPPIKIDDDITTKLSHDVLKIICIGRFVECKGQEYLVRAISEVIKSHQNLHVTFIGDGGLLSQAKKLASDLKLDEYISFKGSLSHDKVIDEIRKNDIIVAPSIIDKSGREESLGIVLAEAGLCGKPAIASNIGGIPEIVIDKKTGLLVEEKNINQLASSILEYVKFPDMTREFGDNASNHSHGLFDSDKQINKLKDIYEKSLSS